MPAINTKVQAFKCHHADVGLTDKKPPPTPTIVRAIAFDVAKGGSALVPPAPNPAPAPVARRDPVLLEMTGAELGATFAFVSLSDNPDARLKYADVRKWMMTPDAPGESPLPVFDLPLTGYDQNTGRATVLLDFEAMKEKGVTGGEEIAVFQIDRHGNVSEVPAEQFIDPRAFATSQVATTDVNGRAVNVPGLQIDFQKGLHGVDGVDQIVPADQRGVMQRVLAVAVADTTAPNRVEKQITIRTLDWSKKEKDIADHLLNGPGVWNVIQQQMGGGITVEKMQAAIKSAEANPARSPFAERTLDTFRALVADPKLFERFDIASNGPATKDAIIGQADLQEVFGQTRTAWLQLDNAFESGVTGMVTVTPGLHQMPFNIQPQTRAAFLKMPAGFDTGDQVAIEFQDRAGNPGKAVSFEYNAAAPNGKAANDLLQTQGKNHVDVTLKSFNVDGKEVRMVPNALAPRELASNGTITWATPNAFVVNQLAQAYEANAAALGLPKGNQTAVAGGVEQVFERGKMSFVNNAIAVTLN